MKRLTQERTSIEGISPTKPEQVLVGSKKLDRHTRKSSVLTPKSPTKMKHQRMKKHFFILEQLKLT